jgi:chemotaxis response regulator CheB
MQLLSRIKEHAPETPVVVITAFGSIESAVEAMRGGAVDYLPKPFEEARLHLAIERGLEMHALLKENISLRREVRTTYNLEHIVAESAQMRAHKCHGDGAGGKRHGQGTGHTSDPRAEQTGPGTVHCHQLRGDGGFFIGKRIVRS